MLKDKIKNNVLKSWLSVSIEDWVTLWESAKEEDWKWNEQRMFQMLPSEYQRGQ